jgi:transposase
MLGALDIRGVRALMTVEGGTEADVFEAFLTHVLVPKLRSGDIVILDNVGAHKPESMRSLIEGAGASLIFLPPYSPDMNPIELCWSKLNNALKDFGPRTVEDLHQAIRPAMGLVCADDARDGSLIAVTGLRESDRRYQPAQAVEHVAFHRDVMAPVPRVYASTLPRVLPDDIVGDGHVGDGCAYRVP